MNREMFELQDFLRNLKCFTKTSCITTETASLMGNSLGHGWTLGFRVDVRRKQ